MTRDRVRDRSTIAAGTSARSAANRRFGDADFDGWVRGWLDALPAGVVLDLCCGTGNQLVLYASRPECLRMIGVDLSPEALAIAGERLESTRTNAQYALIEAELDTAFAEPALEGRAFDTVSCFYGLYYARDPASVLRSAYQHLAPGGAIVVVGPYGDNNASLFALLQRHFELPPLVLRSAGSFMTGEVVPALRETGAAVTAEKFVNRVRYPDATSVMQYWRASTFYEPAHEVDIARDLDAHFSGHDEFVVEKHVMAALARKA